MKLLMYKVCVSFLLILNCFLVPILGQSGDGEVDSWIIDEENEEEEKGDQGRIVMAEDKDENFVTEVNSMDIYISEETHPHENSTVTFIVHNPDNSSDVEITTKKTISRSAMGPIILVVVLIVLLIFGCCAWRIIALRKKKNRTQSLRHQAMTRHLSESEKGSKELIVIRRSIDKFDKKLTLESSPEEVQPLSEKEIREEAETGAKWSLPFATAPLPVTFTTFQTPVTISRRTPPPSYTESLNASKENVIGNDLDLGPTYR